MEEHKCPRCRGSLAPSYEGEAKDKFLKCQHCGYLHDVRDAGMVETEEVEEYTDENGNRVTRTRRVLHKRSDFAPRTTQSRLTTSGGPSFLITEGMEGFEHFNALLKSVSADSKGSFETVMVRTPEELEEMGLGQLLKLDYLKGAEVSFESLDAQAIPNGGVIIDAPYAESIIEQLSMQRPPVRDRGSVQGMTLDDFRSSKQKPRKVRGQSSSKRQRQSQKSRAKRELQEAPSANGKRLNGVLRFAVALLLGAVAALGFVVVNR